LSEDSFSWSRWRAFNIIDVRFCYQNIIAFRNVLRKYAVGYRRADYLRCRPKTNCYAVMFLKNGIFSWCHLTEREYNETF